MRGSAATAAGRTRDRAAAPRPRRISGPAARAAAGAAIPARPRIVPRPVRRPASGGRAAVGALVHGFIDVAASASSSRWMDRLVRSRAWVGIVAFALMGIVAMQVSLLQLNTGIGRAVEAAETLERSNSALRVQNSRLSSGERIQRVAGERGLIMPAPRNVRYLDAGDTGTTARRAARAMRAPDPSKAAAAGVATQQAAPDALADAPATGAPAVVPEPEPAPQQQAAAPEPTAPAPAPEPRQTAPAPTPAPAPEPAAAPAATPTGAVAAP